MHSIKKLLNLYIKIFKTLNLNLKKKVIYIQVFNIVAGIIDVLGILSIAPLIGIIVSKDLVLNNLYISKFYNYFNITSYENLIIIFSIIIAIIYSFSIFIKILQRYINLKFSNDLYLYYSSHIFNHFLNKDYLFHKQTSSSELISKTYSDTQRFQSQIITASLELISNTALSALIFTSLLVIDFKITLSIFIVFIAFYLIYFFLLKKKLKRSGKLISLTSQVFFKYLFEGFKSIKEAIIFNKLSFLQKNFESSNQLIVKENIKIDFYSNIPRQLIELISFLIILILLCTLIVFLNYSFEKLAVLMSIYSLCLMKILPALQKIYLNIVSISSHIYSFYRISPYLSDQSKLKKNENSINQKSYLKFEKNIKLENINFSYPSRDKAGVQDINLEIKKGQKVCIIGESGSGKSTLMDILLGLLKPVSGNFFIDDMSINLSNFKDWHKKISFVSQDIYISESSIKENIAFGEKIENIDEEKIKQILLNLNLKEFSSDIDQNLGEMGSRISGGQRQRFSLARAIYRDSQILFIDEGTSSLDKENSNIITEYIFDLYKNKTMILIAHSKELFKKCDVYFEMNNGKIKNFGYVKEVKDQSIFKSLN